MTHHKMLYVAECIAVIWLLAWLSTFIEREAYAVAMIFTVVVSVGAMVMTGFYVFERDEPDPLSWLLGERKEVE